MANPKKNYSEELLQAARINDTSQALAAIKQKESDLKLIKDTHWSSSGWTALHWAAYHNNTELYVEILKVFPEAYVFKTDSPWLFGYGKIFGFNGKQTPLHLINKNLEIYDETKKRAAQENTAKDARYNFWKFSEEKDALDNSVNRIVATIKENLPSDEKQNAVPLTTSYLEKIQEKQDDFKKDADESGQVADKATKAIMNLNPRKALSIALNFFAKRNQVDGLITKAAISAVTSQVPSSQKDIKEDGKTILKSLSNSL